MSIILLIASIALSACQSTDLSTVCFSDLSAPLVYAYDPGSREALIIERFVDRTSNTSYRFATSTEDNEVIIKDSWLVDEAGASVPVREYLPTDYFVEHWPLREE